MARSKSLSEAMKIKLVRTGGFIPVTRAAETEINISDSELASLLVKIKPDADTPRIKDGNYYELTVGSRNTPVDLEKVPQEFKDIFSKLKSDLKIIKQ
jgi:hypothetical protein